MEKRFFYLLTTCCLFSSLLGVFLGGWWWDRRGEPDVTVVNPTLEELRLRTFASSAPTDFTTAAEAVTPSVVFVRNFLRDNSSFGPNTEATTTGSGVILSADGFIATNNHVIEGAERLRITLDDKREYDARLIGVDASTDLALLKIEARGLPSLMFGNSDSLRIGEWVLAVGNPFSLQSTVTAGIVSAKGRSIDVLAPEDRIESFIQTDAAVNPGNSGGALVNTNGELIGINTAIITNSGRHEGFAFAIPGNLANRVLRDLRNYGEVRRGVLGAYLQSVNDAQARELGLDRARGVIVSELKRGGAAVRAGLEVGDVLMAINGVEVAGSPAFQEQMSRYRPGQKVRLTYVRKGRKRNVTVLLRDKSNAAPRLVSERADDLLHRLGLEVRGLAKGRGVRVISVFRDSPVEATNMNVGFVIEEVNGQTIGNINGFLDAVATGNPLLFGGRYPGYKGKYYYELE